MTTATAAPRRDAATSRSLTPSSFAWSEQGILYVGKDLPDPGRARDAWLDAAGERLVRLVNAAGGRALVLCTSHANVDRFAQLLRDETDHDVLAQGDADVGTLSRTFAEDEASVLVGTRSFWAGIDTPGVSCVLVVIDRIPFPSPGEPLNATRRSRAEIAGDNPFATVDLPEAALVLAQGAGRLIRRRDDRGVVAVLDARLATRITAVSCCRRCRRSGAASISTKRPRSWKRQPRTSRARDHTAGEGHRGGGRAGARAGCVPGVRRRRRRSLHRRERDDGVPARTRASPRCGIHKARAREERRGLRGASPLMDFAGTRTNSTMCCARGCRQLGFRQRSHGLLGALARRTDHARPR